jgi:S1-C subfamily serine protease
MQKVWILLGVLLLGASVARADVDLDRLRASVVAVDVVVQGEDYRTPWQAPTPYGTGGSGFYIGNGRILTNAHVVSEAKVVRLKRPDRPEKVDARVLFIAHDCDLALITVDDPKFFDGMEPLEIGGVPKLRSTVTAVGYPIGGRKLSITEGVVSRIELTDYVHTGADRHLGIQIDAAINPGNSGGAVIQDDKVVGVAFQTQFFAQNIGYMIPTPVIKHFLKDIEDGKYDGYPLLGVVTSTLENDALRTWLKVPEGETGVLILKALPWSSADGLVQKNDVLLGIDDVSIENDGTVKVGDDYLELAYVVQEHYAGDTVTLKIVRDGKKMDVPVTLKVWNIEMSQRTAYGERPEYLVLGGFLFVPLTANYVQVAGWRSDLNYWLSEFYRSIAADRPGQKQLVVLSRVLPDDSNRYRTYYNSVVKTVNGERPVDFRDFVRRVTAADRAVIEFEGVNVAPLILEKKKIEAVQKSILEKYGIPSDRYLRKED